MKRLSVVITATVLGCGMAGFALATDQSSSNFSTQGSTFSPTTFNASSSNFQLNASLDSIVGGQTNMNFQIQAGVPLNDPPTAAPPPPPPSGSGGGGGLSAGSGSGTGTLPPPTPSSVPSPTFTFRSPTFLSHQLLAGTRDPSSVVLVNGSESGVTYPDATHWQRDLPLFLGLNDIRVWAKDSSGATSNVIGATIERMLIGDVNRSRTVDDFDLSLFTRAWTKYTPFADFNEDGKVDDLDLSLLASHWNMSY